MNLPSDKTLRLFQWALFFFMIAAIAQLVAACIRLYLLYTEGDAP